MPTYSYEFQVACAVLEMIVNVPTTVMFMSFFMFHCRNVYLDLYTSERVSVSHRRRAPEITVYYTRVAYFTILAAFFGLLASIGITIRPFVITGAPSITSCALTAIIGSLSVPSKLFVYFVFSVRYMMVYGGSQYAAKERTMKFVNGLLLSVAVLLFVWILWSGIAVSGEKNETSTDWTNGEWSLSYENSNITDMDCYYATSNAWMSLYALFDLCVNVAYCVKFILPIWQVIRLVQGSSRNVIEKSKLEKKMLFVGFKVFILSAVLFGSTIGLVVFYSDAFMPATTFFPVDAFINFLCLALMTPYYPDSKYYQRLCACCIFCCDRKGYTKKAELNDEKVSGDIAVGARSPGDDENADGRENREVTEEQTVFSSVSDPNQSGSAATQTVAASIDTMSAVRIAANDEASSKPLDGNNTRDQASVEIELAQNLGNEKEAQ